MGQIKKKSMKLQAQNSAPTGGIIVQYNEITKIFADHYTKISRDPHMKSNPNKYIRRKKENNQLIKNLFFRKTKRGNPLYTVRELKATKKHSTR